MKQPCRANADDVRFAAERLIEGTVKKVLLADNLAILVNTAYADPAQFSGLELAFAAVAYALQIYCDFSAYSDMAIGSARLFGITLMENFHAPYMAQSSKEFWHRWHISLSTWFRDYLYFPLGGSRKGKARTYINVLIVFALSGLWHGAAMKYVLWGLLFGVFQVIGGLLTPAKQRLCAALHIPWDAGWLQIIRVIITFGLSTFAWIFFRADSALQACAIIKRIVTAAGACFPLDLTHLGLTERALHVLAVSLIGLVLTDIIGDRFPLREKLLETVWLRYAVWVILLAVTAVCGAYGTGFNPQNSSISVLRRNRRETHFQERTGGLPCRCGSARRYPAGATHYLTPQQHDYGSVWGMYEQEQTDSIDVLFFGSSSPTACGTCRILGKFRSDRLCAGRTRAAASADAGLLKGKPAHAVTQGGFCGVHRYSVPQIHGLYQDQHRSDAVGHQSSARDLF
ncbi:MAG: MBOAT family O-acyltransferase [Butyricicoccus sp.]